MPGSDLLFSEFTNLLPDEVVIFPGGSRDQADRGTGHDHGQGQSRRSLFRERPFESRSPSDYPSYLPRRAMSARSMIPRAVGTMSNSPSSRISINRAFSASLPGYGSPRTWTQRTSTRT